VDLRTAIESAVDVVTPIAAAKRVRLDTDLPPVASIVQADFARLRQILWNLLSNAIKFTPAGGFVTLQVRADERTYSIVVSDTGVGIAPDFLPHVFERFRQADGSTTREHGGLGLGLALVKELAELHGGAVAAASGGAGAGATFTVTLPRLVATADAAPEHDEDRAISRLDGVQILAVDDNADALDIVAAALASAGANVRLALSGREAVEELRRAPPDLVLCDLAMPGMDGFAVLKWIREHDRALARSTPVLAVTAYASDEYRERCLRAGFQGHIAKPIRTADLVREVVAALARV
jgi:CheY-like chemotaxis protein